MTCHGALPRFPEEFLPQIYQVEDLDLLKCNFSFVPKDAFKGLNALRSLLINCNNKVTDMTFDEGALHHLANLQLLSLNYNDLRSLPPKLLCGISNLEFLYLTGNSLASLADLGFGSSCDAGNTSCNGRRISTLVLKENSIRALPPNALCSLRNLTRLDLSGNGLTSIDDNAFSFLGSLQDLDLSDNNFSTVSVDTLKDLPNLRAINLGDNLRLANVSHILRHLPTDLKVLNLTNIGLEDLEGDYFRNVPRLNSLILDRNSLRGINESVLRPLVGLQNSSLKCQRAAFFTGMPEEHDHFVQFDDFDRNVTGLRFFSLESNNFTDVPPIGVLNTLEAVSLARNLIRTLKHDDFVHLSNLQVLHLSFNRIETIDSLVFSNVTCLREVHLDHNGVRFMDQAAFDTNVALTDLYLQFNEISSVQGMFRKNVHLQKLNLSHNLLEEVSLGAFPLGLIELDLSANFLKVISQPKSPFPLHLKMDFLDLSNNQLSYISKDLFPISLTRLLLNDNRIANISDCTFCATGTLSHLSLHDNRLTTARWEWLYANLNTRSNSTSVTLRGNPLVCDCLLQKFLGMVRHHGFLILQDFEMLQCRREYAIGKQPLLSIPLAKPPEDFLCRFDYAAWSQCTIYHDFPPWQFAIVDCSNRNLTSIPVSFPKETVKMHFDGNRLSRISNWTFESLTRVALQELHLNACHIEEVDDGTFSLLTDLTVLHLEDNRLRRLSRRVFDGLHRLLELFLSSNRLHFVDDDSFLSLVSIRRLALNDNHLTAFPVWKSLKHLEGLQDVSLSDNPWSCDCDFVDQYREWLQEFSSKVTDVNDLFCKYDDNSTSTVPLIAFNEANCYSGQRANSFLESKYFPVAVSVSSVIVFLIISVALLFVYRREMQVLIYSRYGVRIFSRNVDDDNDADKIFDGFVSYSHDDEEFVMGQLVPKLEDMDPPFRICLHHRDFQVGVFITDNIFEAIAKSRRSILVLSDNFMRSEWCRFEFKTAHLQMFKDSSHRVILIILGDVPENLDPEMRNYLKTNTYLQWGDKLFYERLYFAMPDRKAATDDGLADAASNGDVCINRGTE